MWKRSKADPFIAVPNVLNHYISQNIAKNLQYPQSKTITAFSALPFIQKRHRLIFYPSASLCSHSPVTFPITVSKPHLDTAGALCSDPRHSIHLRLRAHGSKKSPACRLLVRDRFLNFTSFASCHHESTCYGLAGDTPGSIWRVQTQCSFRFYCSSDIASFNRILRTQLHRTWNWSWNRTCGHFGALNQFSRR